MTQWLFDNIDKRFGKRQILARARVSIRPGECELLCGGNGAGKSTLLRILAGMEKPNHIIVEDENGALSWRLAKRRLLRDFIYLHQQPYLFEGTVAYNLNYPLRGSRVMRERLIERGLEWSGLTELADQPVHQLSGGERQRVAMVRAWLRAPKVMLLDEPTTNMDLACRQRTTELLLALKQEGVALLIATHDAQHFAGVGDRILQLSGGKLSEVGPEMLDYPDKVTPINARTQVTA